MQRTDFRLKTQPANNIVFPLYPIVDTGVCAARGLDARALAEAFLRGGARLLQLRDKSPSTAARLALADDIVARAHAAGAQVVINDRADVARLAGADGVHVGQEDLLVEDARVILGASAIVGISTHTSAQVAAAAASSATYLAVGPVFGTTTKETGYTARARALVREAAATGKPVVAIGGITLDRAHETIAAGAASLAVITDLLTADPEGRVREFLRRIGG